MPSFRHEPSSKRFFFAHIPRTAGRYVEANILGNDNQIVWDDDWEGLGIGRNVMNMYKKVELAHFHRSTMNSTWMWMVFLIFQLLEILSIGLLVRRYI